MIFRSVLTSLISSSLTTQDGRVVHDFAKPPICVLYDPNADRRPMLSNIVTLNPSEPLIRRVDISKIVSSLPDGRYEIRTLASRLVVVLWQS